MSGSFRERINLETTVFAVVAVTNLGFSDISEGFQECVVTQDPWQLHNMWMVESSWDIVTF